MDNGSLWPRSLFGRRIGPTTNGVYVGALVQISRDASFWNGEKVERWYRFRRWYVTELNGNKAKLGRDETGRYTLSIPVSTNFLTVIDPPEDKDGREEGL